MAAGLDRFGRIDIVSANAGITGFTGKAWELSRENWQAVIDIDLTGTWQTVKAAAPAMIEQRSGSIVITASTMGVKGTANLVGYVAAKHGVIGLMQALAHELAPFSVRVNAVAPTSVAADMIFNDAVYRLFRPDQPTQARRTPCKRSPSTTCSRSPGPRRATYPKPCCG